MSDSFWKALSEGHATSPKMSSADAFITGKSNGPHFERVRALTDRERSRQALDLATPAGTKVAFTGGLGSVLTYEDPPAQGMKGEIVTAKSANGDITHHDGKFFVQWEDGKFRPIHAVHLRKASAGEPHRTFYASEQEADKLEAEAEANEAQAEADRQKADAARMKEGASRDQVMAYRAGKYSRKNKEFGNDMDWAAREWVARREDPDSEEGKAMEVAFILGWLGKPMPRKAYDRSFASRIEKATGHKFIGAEDAGESGELYSFESDSGDVFEIYSSDGSYSMEAERGWKEFDSEKDLIRMLGRMLPRKASDIRCASLGDLTDFLKVAEGKLIHKSTKDLWSFQKDADGMFVVTRLFDDVGEPLKG